MLLLLCSTISINHWLYAAERHTINYARLVFCVSYTIDEYHIETSRAKKHTHLRWDRIWSMESILTLCWRIRRADRCWRRWPTRPLRRRGWRAPLPSWRSRSAAWRTSPAGSWSCRSGGSLSCRAPSWSCARSILHAHTRGQAHSQIVTEKERGRWELRPAGARPGRRMVTNYWSPASRSPARLCKSPLG